MKQKVFAISDATSNAKTNKEFINRTIEKFFHSLPQMFFVVLPLFALILNLLYIRRRKGYNYVAHAIFTVYFYCFVFLSEIIIQFTKLIPYARYVIRPVFSIGILFYLYKAMRNFYKQGRGKTILKFFILNLVLGITLTILIVVYMFIAAVSVV